ncbi:MAG: L,D-transpeptidase [Bryobacteraceae bacterium]
MRDMRRQWTYTRALAALFVAAGEALAQEPKTPRRRIIVSIPDRQLALLEDDRVVKIYRVAVGADASPSPEGSFTVIRRVANPTWYGPHQIVPPGKSNPVGTRWIGLSLKGYGIHGTSNPKSIGKNASHGCIRLRNADVEELFGLVSVGDAVELHRERTPELARIFGETVLRAGVTAGTTGGQ